MNRWLTFIYKRFSPIPYTLTIIFFLAAHIRVTSIVPHQITYSWKILLLFLATLIFFFLLRLFDELKDYSTDAKIHPDRPLITGLISLRGAKKAVEVCLLTSLLLFIIVSIKGSIAFLLCLVYLLLMYKEFFIGKYLRQSLLLYAITHTFVSTILSISLISSLTDTYFWLLPISTYAFALISWFVFNIFEFGRKTYAQAEEKPEIDSYSKRYTSYGAVGLVLLMLLLIQFILAKVFVFTHMLMIITFIAISAVYLIKSTAVTAKIYRAFCTSYLLLLYLLISIS